VPATADGVAERAKQDGYQAQYQNDDPDRPHDSDLGYEADNQQNNPEYDHDFPLAAGSEL
jgi:hypothetical protein